MFLFKKAENKEEKDAALAFVSLREALLSSGLLVAAAQPSHAAYATRDCGVSISFIRKLLSVTSGFDAMTTESFNQRGLNPLTTKCKKCR